ncbi:MAG: hypothetical protein K0S65_1613 [Labilithrix sp.]|nr:hypothetical protein [Labilithrix sp.]
MRTLFIFAVASLSLVTGCAASSDTDEAAEAQESNLQTTTTTSYEGSFDVNGASYKLTLEVTSTAATSAEQRVDCWKHASNTPLCQQWWADSPAKLTTVLSLRSSSGAVIETNREQHEISPNSGYLDDAESATFYKVPGARARRFIPSYVGVEGITVEVGGAKIVAARGYGFPTDIELSPTIQFTTRSRRYTDDSSADTGLTDHRFQGSVALSFPESIALDVGVVTERSDFVGKKVPVVLVKK